MRKKKVVKVAVQEIPGKQASRALFSLMEYMGEIHSAELQYVREALIAAICWSIIVGQLSVIFAYWLGWHV